MPMPEKTTREGLHTLGRWPAHRAALDPDRIVLVDRGLPMTAAELEHRASRLADRLRGAGYGPGSVLATVSGNSADHVVLLFACAKAGVAMAPLSWRLTPHELAGLLEVVVPDLVVAEHTFSSMVDLVEALGTSWPRVELGEHGIEGYAVLPPVTRPGTDAADPRPAADDDALLLIPTAGTTGVPRVAVLTQANCDWTNRAHGEAIGMGSADVVLSVLPQYHVGGWNIHLLQALRVGALVVLERSFDPGRALRLIDEHRVTVMMGVPSNYALMAQHPDFDMAALTSLRAVVSGGAALPTSVAERWAGRGVVLQQGYGLSEASPNVLLQSRDDALSRPGGVGRPYPFVEVALADPATGAHLQGAAEGELVVRGPNVFAGYHRDPIATADVVRDGWLHTGDLARRDAQDRYWIVGRLKHIFISGGESIAPAEIEAVLRLHPAVADAAVLGVPDERWGEVPVAWVVAAGQVEADDILRLARARLVGFKVPTRVLFVDHIPRTALGKVRHDDLLTLWQQQGAR
ncbi:class I adenylate-forming enzyme family protein [Propionibacteriaceae bacterium G1746]|uniref:class I adenylate-forming enzyme family protein n=1 Tax=Aestuariimicrobium sp. G57 TaxID=3418485 RepID=UPI003C209C48